MRSGFLITAVLSLALSLPVSGQSRILDAYRQKCDTLSLLISGRTGVKAQVVLSSIMRRGEILDFYFSSSIGDIPWTADDISWLKSTLQEIAPENCRNYRTCNIFCARMPLRELLFPSGGNSGKPGEYVWRARDPRSGDAAPIVREEGGQHFRKGLSGRHIALWQSHGRFFEEQTGRWRWQRAPLFGTVEDMYTQSYVLPLLIPMLENAGAYVMTPRERDIQKYEVIVDNDPDFSPCREGLTRRRGSYEETGKWEDAGPGFADFKEIYSGNDNPFTHGTARMTACSRGREGTATAVWTPDIPQRGEYAVYVSYKTVPGSTDNARYTVRHLGGTSRFIVNQRIGGGTWIYLGTFEFDSGAGCRVTLDNGTPEGCRFKGGEVVTADAVKIGGGMGKIARGRSGDPAETYTTSGLPSYMEGALYWMQWSGADSTVTRRFEDDYTNDFADRGAWVSMMSGGSAVNPKEKGKGIPFDLSFAFHTDAGTTPNDSTVGTLAIYTLKCEGSRRLPDGENRMTCRTFAGEVQNQVVSDIRAQYDPEWNRRALADRSYSESRTSGVPAMILELLSHQNFSDMRYGLDPAFRFTVCRAVYKGILKYLSTRYGCHYAVQPLPVRAFSAVLQGDGKAVLSWKETPDTLEPTATPTGYVLYTRIDDGAFDTGVVVRDPRRSGDRMHITVPIRKGHLYSFRIAAFNDGGRSFPSETLSLGVPESRKDDGTVLVVNNFTRVAPPAWFDTPTYAGFDEAQDAGVPYLYDTGRIGQMYQFRRDAPWDTNDNPGFGGSYTDMAGQVIIGNTFDYPAVHGRALMAAGYAFCSAGAAAFCEDSSSLRDFFAADIICGKQVTTPAGCGGRVPDRYSVFPDAMRRAIEGFTAAGGNVLVSGANIGTDLWDRVYQPRIDSTYQAAARTFAKTVLGYRLASGHASRAGSVKAVPGKGPDISGLQGGIAFHQRPCGVIYNVETPDGLLPAARKARTFLFYRDTGTGAGICYDAGGYKAVSIGFPIETIQSGNDLQALLDSIMNYFRNGK